MHRWVGRSVGRAVAEGSPEERDDGATGGGVLVAEGRSVPRGGMPALRGSRGTTAGEGRLTLRVPGPPPDSVFSWRLVRDGERQEREGGVSTNEGVGIQIVPMVGPRRSVGLQSPPSP